MFLLIHCTPKSNNHTTQYELQLVYLPGVGLGIIGVLKGVRICCRVVCVKVRLTENFVEGVRLLDSQKSNTKDQDQRADSHYHSIYSHGKQEQGNEQIHDVSAAKGKEIFPKSRSLKSRDHRCWRFNCDKEHDQTCYRNKGTNQHI